MKIIITLLLLLHTIVASAGCVDIAELRSDKMYINISDGGCISETLISFTTKVSKDGLPTDPSSIQTVPFNDECKLNEDGYSGFSCKSNGKSPLAGATYKLKQHGKTRCDASSPAGQNDAPGYRYECVKGCKKTVPKYLERLEDCC